MSEFEKRIQRLNDAVALREPDRVPLVPFYSSVAERFFGSSYCASGGGYIFDFDGSLDNTTSKNLEAMYETLELYGKY